MIPNAVAENLTVDIETAVAEVCARVPGMQDIVKAFAELARERQGLKIATGDWPGIKVFDEAAFGAGEPLLAGREMSGLHGCFVDAAQKLLPVIARLFPHIGAYVLALRSALATQPKLGAQILEAALAEDLRALQSTADQVGIPVGTLSFLVLEVVKPCLRQAAGQRGPPGRRRSVVQRLLPRVRRWTGFRSIERKTRSFGISHIQGR